MTARPPIQSWAAPLSGGLGGVVIGPVTFAVHDQLRGDFSVVAKSGALWLLGAFLVGTIASRRAASAAAGSLLAVAALGSYYLASDLRYGHTDTTTNLVAFGVAAGLSGALMGMGGYGKPRTVPGRRQPLSGPVAVALIGEGLVNIRAGSTDRNGWLAECLVGLAAAGLVVQRHARNARQPPAPALTSRPPPEPSEIFSEGPPRNAVSNPLHR